MDPELLPGSGSGIKVQDPEPAKSERAYTVNKTVNFGLFVLLDSTVVLNREWQIFVKILLFD